MVQNNSPMKFALININKIIWQVNAFDPIIDSLLNRIQLKFKLESNVFYKKIDYRESKFVQGQYESVGKETHQAIWFLKCPNFKKKLLKVVHFIILSISNQRWKIYTWIFYIHACSVLMRWFLKSLKRWKVHDRVCR